MGTIQKMKREEVGGPKFYYYLLFYFRYVAVSCSFICQLSKHKSHCSASI